MTKKQHVFSILAGTFCLYASANNGTLMSGYGVESSQMGGASFALPLDSLAAANNPAGMAKVGTRIDGSLRVFQGKANNSFLGNENSMDLTRVIPEIGLNYQYSADMTLGMSVFGGGLETDYSRPLLPIPGLGVSKNSIKQVTLAPTVTKKFGSSLYVGFSPTILYTAINTKGVPGFADNSDSAFGLGWRVGALWDVTENTSIGAMYTPRTKAGTWNKYKETFLASSKGRFDAPQQFGLGISQRLGAGFTVAADYMRVWWSDVEFLNQAGGIGYTNQNVYRFGVSKEINEHFTVRAGYSHADNFASPEYANGLFRGPGISNKSYSAGVSYKFDGGYAMSVGYEHQVPASLEGTGVSTGTNLNVNYHYLLLGLSKTF